MTRTTHSTEGQAPPALALGGVLFLSIAAVLSLTLWISDIDLSDLLGEVSPGLLVAGPAGDVELAAGTADAVPAEDPAPAPVAVHIPSLGVTSELLDLGLRDDGALEVPDDAHLAGWWAGGARPGERGPAVIVGHVDSYDGPGIFVDLDQLSPGDRVVVSREDGTAVHFDVDRVEQHPKDAFPTDAVYGSTDGPELRLVTCSGEFDRSARSYEQNLVVFLTLAGWSS